MVREGEVVGEGFHERVGEGHAERNALRGVPPERSAGAVLYVTLEPCSHVGRTPPCTDVVLDSRVARVVACHADPNPEVSGKGFQRLRDAGVEVEVGLLAEEACRENLPFMVGHLEGRPSVTLKWAMSLDGKIATASGESQWISSPAGRQWALELREEHDAILVGSGTVLADRPRLDRRVGLAPGPITKVVLDRRGRTPVETPLFESPGPVVVFSTPEGERALAARGVTSGGNADVVALEPFALESVLRELHARNVRSVLVEGGGEILQAFRAEQLFDSVEVCCAPKLIGGRSAPGPLGGAGVEALVDSEVVERLTARSVGDDLILSGVRRGAIGRLLEAVECG